MYETLNAAFDFPILKTEEEIRLEKEKMGIVPYFTFKTDVEATQLRRFSDYLASTAFDTLMTRRVIRYMDEVYNKGIVSEDRYKDLGTQATVVIVKNKESSERPAAEIFTPSTALRYIESHFQAGRAATVSGILDSLNLSDFLVSNLVFDEKTTQAVLNSKLQDVSPTKGLVYAGQRIINKGEIVTAGIEQILNSMKVEFDANIGFMGSKFLLILGQSLMVLLCLLLLYIVLQHLRPEVFDRLPELLFMLMLQVVIVVGTSLAAGMQTRILLLLPLPVFILFLSAFYPTRLALPVYFVFMLPLFVAVPNNPVFVISNILAGSIAVYVFDFWGRGWKQFIGASIIFLCYLVVYTAQYLIIKGSFLHFDWLHVENYVFTALLVIACYPLVYLLEKLFGFVSISRLRDLADPGNKLLRLLSEKAPGTMQHSLQVANLAGNAAHAIGANALLCRVGALYHDIGKINNPQFFIENQAGHFNPHENLSPEESARILVQHLDDGMAIARKYALPSLVSGFIKSHHGTGRTGYCYTVYCNQGGDPENKEPFTYRGRLPKTQEEVIVSLADAVEAATRSLTVINERNISDIVDEIVAGRFAEHQFDAADISIKDIYIVTDVFKSRLQEIYHERIVYPRKQQD